MLGSLQVRINLISLLTSVLIACGLLAAGAHTISTQIAENMQARGRLAALQLSAQLEKLMSLGLDFDDIIGFDEQSRAVVEKDGKLFLAAVYDTAGNLAFHSGARAPEIARVPVDATGPVTRPWTRHYLVSTVPARNKAGQVRAYVVVLVDRAVVSEATFGVIAYFALIAAVFVTAGLIAHFLFLRRVVIRPLAALVRAVNAVRPDDFGKVEKLEHAGNGEIATLANAFSALLGRLAAARDALVASNAHLEQTVAERTAQLAAANLALQNDIDRRKRLEEELRKLANTDPLTGLANRAFIMPYLEERVDVSGRRGKRFAVLSFDLDGFKKINDTHGHAAGDDALRCVARRVQASCRQRDVLARVGGDEFLILLEDAETPGAVEAFAGKVQNLFEEPFALDGITARLGVSIGGAIYPDHGSDVTSLLAAADSAMYASKHAGGGFRLAA